MATIVSAGNSADHTITAGRTGVFTTTGEGLIRIKSGAQGAGFETRRVTSAAETLIGPFDRDVVVTIIGTSGTTTGKGRRIAPAYLYDDDGAQSLGEPAASGFQSLVSGGGKSRSLTPLFDIFDQQVSTPRRPLTIPTPYGGVGPDLVHPCVVYVPQGWNSWRFWMAYTPYPASNSAYENPCVAVSQDGETWVTPTGASAPLVNQPSGGYNADTHLVMSPDGLTMYLVYRERLAPGANQNNVRIMETQNGVSWSTPRTVLTGTVNSQDYASPSVMWDATNSRWVMISHNLDGGVTYPMQRNVTSGADIYSGWSAPSAVSITNPTGGRTFWHSGFDRLADGRIVGLVQDIVNGGSGAPGSLFAAESLDGGMTFSVRMVYSDQGFYRCHLSLIDGAQGSAGCHAWIGRQVSSFTIQREDWLPGADQRAIDQAFQEFAAFGSWRSSVLWFDNFNRADGAIGTPLVGSALTVDTGTYTISSNTLRTGSAGGNRALGMLTVGDYVVEVTSVAAVGQWWLIFRAVDTSNYWRLGGTVAGSTNLRIQNISGGSVNSDVIVQGPLSNNAITQGDRLRVVCRGRRFRIYVNGRFWQEVTDNSGRFASNVSTGVKFGVQADNAGTTFDNLLVMA